MWDLHRKEGERTLWLSSSGGGLFGRPMTRKSYGALLNFWELFSPLRPSACIYITWSGTIPVSYFKQRTSFLVVSKPFVERTFEA